jgi:hypothetical protein
MTKPMCEKHPTARVHSTGCGICNVMMAHKLAVVRADPERGPVFAATQLEGWLHRAEDFFDPGTIPYETE